MDQLDRTAFRVVDLEDEDRSHEYWWSKTPKERLEGLLALREVFYGKPDASKRLQRVLRVVELGEG